MASSHDPPPRSCVAVTGKYAPPSSARSGLPLRRRHDEARLVAGPLADAGHLLEEAHHEGRAAAGLEQILAADATQPLERPPAAADAVDLDPVRAALRHEEEATPGLVLADPVDRRGSRR